MTLRADFSPTVAATRADRHIIDVLIEERAPHLANSAAWPLMRPAIYAALNYKWARRMADDIGPLSGKGAMEYM